MSTAVSIPSAGIVSDLVARQSSSRGPNTKSIPDQIKMWQAYCDRNGLTPGLVHEEPDTSGTLPLAKRPGLLAALRRVESGQAAVLTVAYSERLTRDPAIKDEVVNRAEANGGLVDSLDMGPISNKTAMQWFAGTVAFAQAKVVALQANEKTQAAKQRCLDAGIPPFPFYTPAYRQREDGRLEQHPHNARIVKGAVQMRLRGESHVAIAKWMNEQGVVHKDGRPMKMHHRQVLSIFNSKLLMGEMHFGTFTPNLSAIDDPLLDRRTWEKLQATKISRGRFPKSERLLSRQKILYCDGCGSRLCVNSNTSRGALYPYYRCGNGLCEKPAGTRCVDIEDIIRDEAIRLAGDTQGRADFNDALEAARVAAEKAEAKLAKTIRIMADVEDEDEARELLGKQRAARDAAVAEHERLLALSTPALTVTAADWDVLTLDEKRGVVRATIERVVVTAGREPVRDRISIVPFQPGS